MAEPFLSEIRIFSFNFPPKGWALCNGQLLPINQNQALFALLGTNFGGNGQTNFGLPNIQGQVPIHTGDGHTLGERAGASSVTVSSAQMPGHTHALMANTTQAVEADGNLPATGKRLANAIGNSVYGPATNLVAMAARNVSNVGGSQPHTNMMPYLVLNFCIALQGIFPSPN
jgi:microcystin-dependent protein